MSQLHKRFTSDQVKELLERYLKKEVERSYIQEILSIRRRRFFTLLNQYKEYPQHFSIQYQRTTAARISREVEQNILKELTIEKGIIQNKEIPLKSYNYSFIKDHLRKKYRQKVFLNDGIASAETINRPRKPRNQKNFNTN